MHPKFAAIAVDAVVAHSCTTDSGFSGLSILLHGVISLPDATSYRYDKRVINLSPVVK